MLDFPVVLVSLSPPWVLVLVPFDFLVYLLLLRWFISFFPFTNSQLSIRVLHFWSYCEGFGFPASTALM
jgi:hypothetical protein